MTRPRIVFETVAVVLLTASLAIAGNSIELSQEPSRQEIAQQRDLNLYEDGGEFSTGPISEHYPKGEIPNIVSLRAFILNHWKQQKRGYIRFSQSRTKGGKEIGRL
jgi:hypothetical protein